MIYFLAPIEGGEFIKINRPSLRPKIIIKYVLKRYKYVAVFKNGIIHDTFLPNPRRRYDRRVGRHYYKELLKLNLNEETIL